MKREPDEELGAIIRTDPSTSLPEGVRVVSRFGSIATVRYPPSLHEALAQHDGVEVTEPPKPVRLLDDEDGRDACGLRTADGQRGAVGATGRGVIVAAIDWGCDFAHPAFRRSDGTTRLLALWDQRGPASGASNRWGYGRIFETDEIDRALEHADPYQALDYHPADADDPDAEEGAHGTHVLDIAAGRDTGHGTSGMAPDADLIFVHLDKTTRVLGVGNLGDSVAILEALDFVFSVAGDRPCVVNMSVGAHGGPHDGSTLVEQGVDEAVSQVRGRAVTNSAGNYFGAAAHAEGRIAQGETVELPLEVPQDDATDSEVELFYPLSDRVVVSVIGPDGEVWAEVRIGEEHELASNGISVGRVVHRARHPTSEARHLDLFLFPHAPQGHWRLRLFGEHVEHGHIHGWVERELGPRPHFTGPWASARTTTGTLCNGRLSITVGAYDAHAPDRRVGRFSSAGPTRDGRMKPELVAPGVRICAARSSARGDEPGARYTVKSGTSMAAPHVAGVVALVFESAEQPLEIAETRAILLRSAREPEPLDSFSDPDDVHRLGVGYLDATRAVHSARAWARSRNHGVPDREEVVEPEGLVDVEETGARVDVTDSADVTHACSCHHPGASDMNDAETRTDEEQSTFADKLWSLVSLGAGGGDPVSMLALSALGREGGRLSPVAEAGRPLGDGLLPGDVLMRRTYLGEQSGIVLSGTPTAREELATRGVDVEAAGPGGYVEVLELSPRPRRIGRRVTDSVGRLGRGQTIWRARDAQESIAVDDVLDEMDGLKCRIVNRFIATRGATQHTFPQGYVHAIDSFGGAGEDLTLEGFDVPKLVTEPAPDVVAGMRWYSLPLADQRAAVLKNHQQLDAWVAQEPAYKKNHTLWEKEKARLESLLQTRVTEYNRMWVRLMMYNRFDPYIARWTDHYNKKLSPADDLDPNIVKSLLFQESRMGTHGDHLMPGPWSWNDADRHPIRSRFNIGQAVDSFGPIQWLMLKEMAPKIWQKHKLDDLEPRKVWLGMSSSAYGTHPTFFKAVREFFEARNPDGTNLMGTLHRDLHEDYEFWVRTSIRWLFHKYESQRRPSWPHAVEAYNGGGSSAKAYRKAVMARLGSGPFKAVDTFPDGGLVLRDATNAEAASDLRVSIKNRLLRWDDVAGATVDLLDAAGATVRSGVSSNSGAVTLALAGVADGGYRIRVTPASASNADVGPALGGAAAPTRIWRPLICELTIAGERATAVVGMGAQLTVPNRLALTLQPVWIRSPYRRNPRRQPITHIVIHHTAGPVIGPALNQFLSGGTSAHYVIDTDGQIVKMVHEDDESWHAGCSFWEGREDLNQFAIGIEIVNSVGPFTNEQYDAVIALLQRITTAFPAIHSSTGIIGHADISTSALPTNPNACDYGATRHLDRKSGDPGLEFDWARLEAAGFGLRVHQPCYTNVRGIYGGFFDTVPGGELQAGDADATHRYGGAVHATIQGIVAELQRDLLAVGYFCRVSGSYDRATVGAVQMLQEHFYSAGRRRPLNRGHVDKATAELLKQLVACKRPQVGDFPVIAPTDPRYALASPPQSQARALAVSTLSDLEESSSTAEDTPTFTPEDLAPDMAGLELKLLEPFSNASVTWATGTVVNVVTWTNTAQVITVELGAQRADVPKELLAPNAIRKKATYTSAKSSFDVEVPLYTTNLAALRKAIKEGKAAGKDQSNNYRVLNKKLIVELQLNRFDSLLIAFCSHYHALIGEPKGWVYLSPGWVKSMMIEESTAGTAGIHLVAVPGFPMKNRFNLLQAIDDWGPQQVIMLQELEPTLWKASGFTNIIADRDKLEAEWQLLDKKASKSAAETSRLETLDKLRFGNPALRRSPKWSPFFRLYPNVPMTAGSSGGATPTPTGTGTTSTGTGTTPTPTGTTSTPATKTFFDLVKTFLGTGPSSRQESYKFWIQTGIRWLYEKRKPLETWSDAVRAYNGAGARAEFYRAVVLTRARAAAAAGGIDDAIWMGLRCDGKAKAPGAPFDLCQFERVANNCEPRC